MSTHRALREPTGSQALEGREILRILIAEDSPADAELIVAALRRAGYRVSFDVVDSLPRFEEMLSQAEYDLVLSDHNLQEWTGMDGLEAFKKSGKDIPFLVVTASLGDEPAVEYLKSGATDYVLKNRLERLPLAVGHALREKTQREEAARLSEAILVAKRDWQLTFDTVPDLVLILDREGIVLRANRAVAETTGSKFSEIIGRPCGEVVHGISELCRQRPHQRFQESGEPQRGDIEETRLGKIFEAVCTSLLGRDGRVRGAVVVMRDITDRKRAEEEINRLFTLSLDLLCVAGFDGYFKRLNPAWEEKLGYKLAELMAKPYVEFLHPDDRERTVTEVKQSESGHITLAFQNRYRCKDGSYKWLSWNAYPISAVQLIYMAARDITEHIKSEEAIQKLNQDLELRNREVERANLLKSQFLASMSHELRTPLNAILGFSSLLRERNAGPLTEKQVRYLDHIQRGGQHLLQLINDILDLSKIEAGQLELHREHFPIAQALPEVLSLIRPLAMARKIQLAAPDGAGLYAYADPVRFKQILYNLLSNAVKFTPQGGQIAIEACVVNDSLQVAVRDTGVGIAPDELGSIFNEFHQVGITTRGVKEGTGLGLAITKRLVEQHGGRIWVESEPGTGSCFYFSLPAQPAAEASLVPLIPTAAPRSRPLILVVDDEPAARELIVQYLQPEGYETLTAASRAEAVSLARQARPNAITLNMLTPGKAGWQTLAELRADPHTASIPVILISVIDGKQMGFAMGASEYLMKPVAKADLLRSLRKYLPLGAEGPPTLLVVDDEADDLQMMTEVLRAAGFAVRAAGGGREALRLLGQERPQAVLLDLLMPEVDGFEVIRRMKEHPQLRHVPVLVLTAKELTEMDEDLLRRETQAFFRKGASWKQELLKQIRLALGEPERRAQSDYARGNEQGGSTTP